MLGRRAACVPETAEMLPWLRVTFIVRLTPDVSWALDILPFRFALSRVSDFRQIELDQWRHLEGLPGRLFGLLRPGEGKVPDLSGCLGVFHTSRVFRSTCRCPSRS